MVNSSDLLVLSRVQHKLVNENGKLIAPALDEDACLDG